MKKIIVLIVFSLLLSCSPDEPSNVSGQKLLTMARVGDPNLRLVIPKDLASRVVDCSIYTPPCKFGYQVVIKKIPLKALNFDNSADALHAAKRIKGFVYRNWAFDDVRGEPILERFVLKYLKAEKAF